MEDLIGDKTQTGCCIKRERAVNVSRRLLADVDAELRRWVTSSPAGLAVTRPAVALTVGGFCRKLGGAGSVLSPVCESSATSKTTGD